MKAQPKERLRNLNGKKGSENLVPLSPVTVLLVTVLLATEQLIHRATAQLKKNPTLFPITPSIKVAVLINHVPAPKERTKADSFAGHIKEKKVD